MYPWAGCMGAASPSHSTAVANNKYKRINATFTYLKVTASSHKIFTVWLTDHFEIQRERDRERDTDDLSFGRSYTMIHPGSGMYVCVASVCVYIMICMSRSVNMYRVV